MLTVIRYALDTSPSCNRQNLMMITQKETKSGIKTGGLVMIWTRRHHVISVFRSTEKYNSWLVLGLLTIPTFLPFFIAIDFLALVGRASL